MSFVHVLFFLPIFQAVCCSCFSFFLHLLIVAMLLFCIFQDEMQRFVKKIVELMREENLFSWQGGPIIMLQVVVVVSVNLSYFKKFTCGDILIYVMYMFSQPNAVYPLWKGNWNLFRTIHDNQIFESRKDTTLTFVSCISSCIIRYQDKVYK